METFWIRIVDSQHNGGPNMSPTPTSRCRLRPGLQRLDGRSRVPRVLWLSLCPCWDEMHHDWGNCHEQSPADPLRWRKFHPKR